MKKVLFLILLSYLFGAQSASAQVTTLNEAKYITTLKVVVDHKMKDADIVDDVAKLREHQKFKQDLAKMLKKLDNSRPSEAKNRMIMKILERTGKEIYNELK